MLEFSPQFQRVIDSAVAHLGDDSLPEPDLSPLEDWVLDEGWEYAADGLIAQFVDRDRITDYFSDESLADYVEIHGEFRISDEDRLHFARKQIQHLLSESLHSLHAIDLEIENGPTAFLCLSTEYCGQYVEFYNFKICRSANEYRASQYGTIIVDTDDLSDDEILAQWKRD